MNILRFTIGSLLLVVLSTACSGLNKKLKT